MSANNTNERHVELDAAQVKRLLDCVRDGVSRRDIARRFNIPLDRVTEYARAAGLGFDGRKERRAR